MSASDHLNRDQFIDLYHHTDPEAAQSIVREGQFRPRNRRDDVFFAARPHGHFGVWGSAAVHVRMPASQVEEAGTYYEHFPDPVGSEQSYMTKADKIRPEHILGIE